MNLAQNIPFTALNSLPLLFPTGHTPTDTISENLLLNSDAFAILIPPQSPAFIRTLPSRQPSESILSLTVDARLPYLEVPPNSAYCDIKFTLISGPNLRQLHDALAGELGYIQRPSSIPLEIFFRFPIWSIGSTSPNQDVPFNQQAIVKFAHKLKNQGFTDHNLLLTSGWDQADSYLKVDKKKFPQLRYLLGRLHRRGYTVGLTVNSEISLETLNFLNKRYFLKNGSDTLVLNETQRSLTLDYTNPEAVRWFLDRMDKLKNISNQFSLTCAGPRTSFRQRMKLRSKQKFDFYQFSSLQLPSDDLLFHDRSTGKFPSLFTQKYLQRLTENFGNSAILENGFKSQDLSTFLKMPVKEFSWKGLGSFISSVLTLSIAGYSFLIPDFTVREGASQPSEELYIRALQANTFLPSIMFNIPPWNYPENSNVREITRKYINLHVSHSEMILELARRRVQFGEPIVSPLWYHFPDNPEVYPIKDQFMLGPNLLVAPVLEEGQQKRKVYLPKGIWVDPKSVKHTGGGQVEINAPIEELPFFRKEETKIV